MKKEIECNDPYAERIVEWALGGSISAWKRAEV